MTRRVWLVGGGLGLLGACAHRAPLEDLGALLDATGLPMPTRQFSREQLFALTPAMESFIREEVAQQVRLHGLRKGLFLAVRDLAGLSLEYDASVTRTAAEAFEARAGNCLSLVLLTASLAYRLGLSVDFQSVRIEDIWSRSRNFMLLSGHVNLTLGKERFNSSRSHSTTGNLTIDFIPLDEESRLRAVSLTEDTVVAMFMNNRAVELMEQGELGNAHAMLKEALRADPRHYNALNTLGVLYRRHGDLARAEASLRLLLRHDPGNVPALSNLVLLLRQQGSEALALAAEAELLRLQPRTPFVEFERGLAAARAGQWEQARAAFERELLVTPQFDELHFWLGQAYYQLGQREAAARHMELARENALTPDQRRRYAYKLEALRKPRPTATPR